MTNLTSLLKPTLLAMLVVLASGGANAGGIGCLETVFNDDFEDLSSNRYEVGVIISQLGARSASFQLNDGEVVTASSDGGFCFSDTLQGGQPYLISVTKQPVSGTACAADEPIGIVDGTLRINVVCNLTRTEWNDFSWDQTHWN